jgi:glycosyltransferase involved in cell wall biosynthesis
MSVPLVSVVIPAFNAEPFIADTVRKIQACFESVPIDGEILIVDDGSTDGTADAIPRGPNVRLFTFGINQGKGAALREGFRHAAGQVVLFTDADLPYGADSIPLAVYLIKERGYQAVIGDRTLPSSGHAPPAPITRRLLSSLCSLFVRTLLIGGIADTQCGFKAFQGDVARELARLTKVNRFAVDIEILYLLLRYRLEIRRFPVRPAGDHPSTVRAFRDSLVAMWDLGRVRLNWALNRYVSPHMVRVFQESTAGAQKNAAAWLKSGPA